MRNERPPRRRKARAKARARRGSPTPPPAEDPLPRPRWVPAGIDFHLLPRETQTAIVEILNPVFEELVLHADGGLEKSTGLTILHLAWLELLDQLQLGQGACDDAFIQKLTDRDALVARHLQLVDAKVKASYVLVRLREYRHEWGRAAATWQALPAPPLMPSDGRPRSARVSDPAEPPGSGENVEEPGSSEILAPSLGDRESAKARKGEVG